MQHLVLIPEGNIKPRQNVDERLIALKVLTHIKESLIQWQSSNNKIASGKSIRGYKIDIKTKKDKMSALLYNKQKYIIDTLFGRKPGKRPPPLQIRKWMRLKGIQPRAQGSGRFISMNAASYLISNKIGRDGTNPPKMDESFMQSIVSKAYNTVMDDLATGYGDTKGADFIQKTMTDGTSNN